MWRNSACAVRSRSIAGNLSVVAIMVNAVPSIALALTLNVESIYVAEPDGAASTIETYLLEVNEHGQAVGGQGDFFDGSVTNPYRFDAVNGGKKLATDLSEQYAINSAGVSVGNSGAALDYSGNLVTSPQFPATTPPPGSQQIGNGAIVHRLTESGFGMGFVHGVGTEGTKRAARWLDDELLLLDTRADHGSSQSRAWGGNESGDAAGFQGEFAIEAPWEAVVWTVSGGDVTTIILDQIPDHVSSVAHEINDSDQAAGFTETGAGIRLATLWGLSGGVSVLDSVDGFTGGAARGISETGIVVGESERTIGATTEATATAWLDGATGYEAIDLNALLAPEDAAVWNLESARFVHDAGFIVGFGDYEVAENMWVRRGFLMDFSVIPEPGTASLLASGMSILAGARRWARKRPRHRSSAVCPGFRGVG